MIDKIIRESIDNLLVEEFGIIYSLEKFGDYIIERFFNNIVNRCFKDPSYNDNLTVIVDMGWAKRNIQCDNWYGIDELKYIFLKTTVDDSDTEASVEFNENNLTAATIVINVKYGFNKKELISNINQYGQEKMKRVFYSIFKESIMHELTHLIEAVKLKSQYKYPAYAYMGNYQDMQDISFAFSKTEINARVTTLYYAILNNTSLKKYILSYNGDRRTLCRDLIQKTEGWNCVENMRKYISIFKKAINEDDEESFNFVKEFININKESAYNGSKNVFRLKWKKDKYGNYAGDNNDVSYIVNTAAKIYSQMCNMYYYYVKKMYKAADLAIDAIKNG